MAGYIAIPKLSMAMARATIVEWKANEGERVEKDSVVLVIETEKTSWEVKADFTGFLHVLVGEGTEVPPGRVVGLLAESIEELQQIQKDPESEIFIDGDDVKEGRPEETATAEETRPQPVSRRERTPITPIARKMAEEHMVDVGQVVGTGPGGRITKEDIERAIKKKQEQKTSRLPADEDYQGKKVGSVIPLTGMRKSISDHMYRSLSTSAQMTVMGEMDMTEVVKLKQSLQSSEKSTDLRITYTDLLVMVISRALSDHRDINCSVIGNEIKVWEDINIGVAVAMGGEGLIVPVVRNADKKKLGELSQAIRTLINKAQTGRLVPDDVTGGTFTLTSLGRDGMSIFQTPILNQQESAILGAGPITDKPVVRNGQITIVPMMPYSLTFDHRAINGFGAEKFIGRIQTFCQTPALLLV